MGRYSGDFLAFFCPTSPKKGQNTQFYIFLEHFFSLPGTKCLHPLTKIFPKTPTLSPPLKKLPPLPDYAFVCLRPMLPPPSPNVALRSSISAAASLSPGSTPGFLNVALLMSRSISDYKTEQSFPMNLVPLIFFEFASRNEPPSVSVGRRK
jgi:hypothetical protein